MTITESTESSIGFGRYWLILKRRWLPASVVFGSIFALSAINLLLQKPIYEAKGKLLFKKTSPTPSLTGMGREIGELNTLQEKNSPVDTEAEVIRSVPIIQKAIKRLDLKDKRGNPVNPEQFGKKLTVSEVTKTDVLQLSYKDTNPKMAAAVVNTVMAAYLENNLLANRAEAVAAREFLQKQMPDAEANLRQAELELRQFKEDNKLVALDEEARSAVSVIEYLQKQISDTQTKLADANAESQVLRKQLGRGLQQSKTVSSISQLPAVQDILKQVQQVESQLAIERGRFHENHPTIVSLKSKKADLERLLKARVKQVFGVQNANVDTDLQNSGLDQKLTEDYVKSEARRLGLSSQMAALYKLQAAYRQRLNSLPKLEQKQRELERKVQTAQATYTLLQQKFQEIRIAENQKVGNASVISAALVPEDPVTPRQFALLTAALLGTFASAGTIYVLEITDKSIKTVEEARKVFGFTLLGVIPSLKKTEKVSLRNGDLERSTPQIVVRESPRSPFSQAYRMLQANLKFLNSDKELKAIVVTSSVPKEGKSTVSANLAVAMAQMGRKVLLVDADMHRPLQQKIWDLPNHLGLSNIIVGQTELRTAIKKITANLHILTSGVIPPNPMALLDSQRMASLIEVFCANYDYVIIDTPALNVAVDAAILGKMTDGVMLVVRPGVVDTVCAARAKELLQQSGQKVLGQVMNGFVPENEPYSYYHFSSKYYTQEGLTTDEGYSTLTKGKNF